MVESIVKKKKISIKVSGIFFHPNYSCNTIIITILYQKYSVYVPISHDYLLRYLFSVYLCCIAANYQNSHGTVSF